MSITLDAIISLARDYPDMTLRQIGVLCHCSRVPSEHNRQVVVVSDEFGWPRPIISRIGIRLEEMGLLERGQILGDKRTCTFTVTTAGHRALAKALGEVVPKRRLASAKRANANA